MSVLYYAETIGTILLVNYDYIGAEWATRFSNSTDLKYVIEMPPNSPLYGSLKGCSLSKVNSCCTRSVFPKSVEPFVMWYHRDTLF